MKRLMVYLYILVVAFLPVGVNATQVDTLYESSPRVLIISSYHFDTDWSKKISNEIAAKLTTQYPGIYIHTGYMNLDMYALPSNPLYTMRSILWAYADSKADTVDAEDSDVKTSFSSDEYPDVLVFIGEDALFFYQQYGFLLNKWKDVPIVVCATSDYIIEDFLQQERELDFDSLVPIEKRRVVESFLSPTNKIDEDVDKEKHTRDGVEGYLVSVKYNITGVKNTIPVRENLELIRILNPDLKEIVWVDNNFYTANYAYRLLQKEVPAVFPSSSLQRIKQDRFNTDSIYNEIFKPVSDKVYLTYSWDMNGLFSRQNKEQIRTLFINYSTTPLFSLTQRFSTSPYWVGGYYRPYSELVEKTVGQINRILGGESANSIPFETVSGGHIVLDQPLLKKYDLWENAQSLENVEYTNIPPTFYEENEGVILTFVILGTIVLGLLAYWINRYRYTRKIHREYMRYMKLYDKLHFIYGHTSIDLALYNKAGQLIFNITKGKEHLFGSGKSNVFSDNIFESPFLSNGLKAQIQNNQSINSEVTIDSGPPLSALDSEREIYQLIVKPLNEENSRSAHYVAIAINLNPVVREREERERFGALVRFASDSSQMGVAFYNVDSAVGTATNSWYQNLNEPITPGLLPTYGNVAPEDREILLNYRKMVQNGDKVDTFDRDIRVLGEDGEEHWITQHIFVNDKDRKMLIELNLNIDNQKQTERDLLKAKAKVEKSILETQAFLANINHEIRTPLNSIVGFSAILAASENEEERKEHVSLILKNNKLLTMLMDDVIELSKIDSGQTTFAYKPVYVGDLFKKVQDAGYPVLYNKQLNIIIDSHDSDSVIHTDPEAVYRLLDNLLSNAIKFTQEGYVTLGCRKEKSWYYFYVKDTGCGIAPDDQRRIFKRFVKLDMYMQGTGLGLALCKSIVDHLGGEMGVESEMGAGSTFWFTLPAR